MAEGISHNAYFVKNIIDYDSQLSHHNADFSREIRSESYSYLSTEALSPEIHIWTPEILIVLPCRRTSLCMLNLRQVIKLCYIFLICLVRSEKSFN